MTFIIPFNDLTLWQKRDRLVIVKVKNECHSDQEVILWNQNHAPLKKQLYCL
ncbi:hypothetical protein MC7420_4285 [Coleofasciculus chthonoplastes PCC 7420]|uniref:Uncharacterized protein n=1 Tax=Coleofasciculus chthonoplastes PCC 7420 TaxID=118168 RepID=B4W3V8_9CYAN|nr:hypothetical protein MC7420_4285 [Coleofasciculus chthonoplastes PCC 7420]